MKFKPMIIGSMTAMAAMFSACSSDEPAMDGNTPEGNLADKYVSVSIEMPNDMGSRSITENDYEDGTKEESDINNIVFFFFDSNDNCVDVRIESSNKLTEPGNNLNPAITKKGTVELRLNAGIDYKKVAIAINTTTQGATNLKNQVTSVAKLREITKDYRENVKTVGQMMSNSVYYEATDYKAKPSASALRDVVNITEKNIYTAAEKDFDISGKEAVEIFVERVLAKVVVTPNLNMNDYYILEADGKKLTTLPLYDPETLDSKEVKIVPTIEGMILNVKTPWASLIKKTDVTFGYTTGATDYKAFQWNDPQNKRSYWAATSVFGGEDKLEYFSWNEAVNQNLDGFTEYVNPNTSASTPEANNDGHSDNTKVMVVATLKDEDGNAVDLVGYGADYMLASSLNIIAMNTANDAIHRADLSSIASETTRKAVEVALSKVDIKASEFEIAQKNVAEKGEPGDLAWEAKVVYNGNLESYLDDVTDPSVKGAALTAMTTAMDAAVKQINTPTIKYWKEGRTYFYTNIRHQGFYGLVGNGDNNFLYGVVRNHVYKVNISGIYGLGTPVINPGEPINPDRPKDEIPSYMKVNINVLKWRIVENNATIH